MFCRRMCPWSLATWCPTGCSSPPVRRPTAPSTPLRSCWSGCPPPGSPDAMAYRRIAYAALLGGAVLFQIVFRFYLSTFTLALVLLLPLLSVLLSLPSVLGCTLLLTSAAPTAGQGEVRP